MKHLTPKTLLAAVLVLAAVAYAHRFHGEPVGLVAMLGAALVLFGAHVRGSATTKLGTVSVDVADEETKP